MLVRTVLGLILVAYVADALALFDHNEHAYLAAARLVADGQTIYRDFNVSQVPYWPAVLSLPVRFVPPELMLPAGRLFVLLIMAAGALVLHRELRRTAAPAIATGLTVLFLANEHVAQIGRDTSNYAFPMVAALTGYHLLVSGGRAWWWPALAGVFLALAVGSKSYFGAILFPLLIGHALWGEGTAGERGRRVGLCVAGGAVGAIPLLLIALADWPAFLFNNVHFHELDFAWKVRDGHLAGVGFAGKVKTAVSHFGSLSVVEYLLLVAVLLPLAGGRVPRAARTPLLVALTALVVALLATPVFPQYYTMAIPFLVFAVGAAAGSREVDAVTARTVVLAVVVLATCFQLPRIGNSIGKLATPSDWAVTEVAETGRAMRLAVAAAGDRVRAGDDGDAGGGGDGDANLAPDARILTLAPVHALAGGFAIYPELTPGPFFFRNDEVVPLEDQRRWGMAGASRLPELVAAHRPSGIFVGLEPRHDWQLEAIAEDLGFVPVPAGSGTLWVEP